MLPSWPDPPYKQRVLLTITSTATPATDLGHLLRKHPARVHVFDLNFGRAHVFYPEATEERCTAALLLEVDPVGLVRNRRGPAGEGRFLEQYVNDREPLRRVHECVLGVLALESEPVDPRL